MSDIDQNYCDPQSKAESDDNTWELDSNNGSGNDNDNGNGKGNGNDNATATAMAMAKMAMATATATAMAMAPRPVAQMLRQPVKHIQPQSVPLQSPIATTTINNNNTKWDRPLLTLDTATLNA
eukprot:Pgem_evm2s206